MRWYRLTKRRPKRWARRAKSDGSAVPKVKPRIRIKMFRCYSRFQLVHMPLVYFTLLPVLGIFIFLWIMKLDLEGVPISSFCSYFGLPPLFDLFGYLLRGVLLALQIGAVLMLLNIALLIMSPRAERRNAIAHRCHLCPRCGYSLQSRTSDDQPCPECGQRISRREAVRLWCRFCGR